MEGFTIDLISEATDELVEPIGRLLGQLTSSEREFSAKALQRIVQSENSHLFILRTTEIVGMLTLGVYHSPTGCKVWVEDVVVDSRHRGQGLGRALICRAIEYCKREFAPCCLMLTSNPSRTAANALYRTAGFEQKITNVYKHDCH